MNRDFYKMYNKLVDRAVNDGGIFVLNTPISVQINENGEDLIIKVHLIANVCDGYCDSGNGINTRLVFVEENGTNWDVGDYCSEKELEKLLNRIDKGDNITYEVCPYCEEEVMLDADLKVQVCPNCGKHIVTCSMCGLEDCTSNCPLEEYAHKLNGE